jgi:hypothetical protein
MDKWDKYLCPLIQNIMVEGQLSKFRGDRTLWSVVNVIMSEVVVDTDRTRPVNHPSDAFGQQKSLFGCSLMLTGCWHPSVRSSILSLSDISADQMN